jgi:hypothetical protein
MTEKRNDSSVLALDTYGDVKGDVHDADDLRLQQMGSSTLLPP